MHYCFYVCATVFVQGCAVYTVGYGSTHAAVYELSGGIAEVPDRQVQETNPGSTQPNSQNKPTRTHNLTLNLINPSRKLRELLRRLPRRSIQIQITPLANHRRRFRLPGYTSYLLWNIAEFGSYWV